MSNSLQPHGLYSPPGSSVHGTSQARILEWVAIPFSRGSSQPRIKRGSSALQADSLPSDLPGKQSLFVIQIVLNMARESQQADSPTLIFFSFLKIIFNWKIISSQCSVSFFCTESESVVSILLSFPSRVCPTPRPSPHL